MSEPKKDPQPQPAPRPTPPQPPADVTRPQGNDKGKPPKTVKGRNIGAFYE
jgi:hypothetical protein